MHATVDFMAILVYTVTALVPTADTRAVTLELHGGQGRVLILHAVTDTRYTALSFKQDTQPRNTTKC